MTRWTSAAPRAPRILPSPSLRRLALTALLAAGTLLALLPGTSRADAIRDFPEDALRGRLQVLNPPAVRLNGKDDVLAMGARIRDSRNLFVTSGTLADGSTHVVNYTRNGFGQISEVWMLSAEEAAIRRRTTAAAPATN